MATGKGMEAMGKGKQAMQEAGVEEAPSDNPLAGAEEDLSAAA
jgi:hypothetical protein